MQFDQPICYLRTPRCACCSGQGALCFSACPACGTVVLVCEEAGTVHLDIRDLDRAVYAGLDDPACLCPGCSAVPVSGFRNATAAEVQQLGLGEDVSFNHDGVAP